MTPTAHWSPEDYYRASRNARAAWERQDHQLSILSDSPALAMLGLAAGERQPERRNGDGSLPSNGCAERQSLSIFAPCREPDGLGTGGGEACRPSSMAAAASPVPSPSSDASLSRRAGSTTPTGEEPV